MAGRRRQGSDKNTRIETFTHDQARRWHIPTAELQALVREDEAAPKKACDDLGPAPPRNFAAGSPARTGTRRQPALGLGKVLGSGMAIALARAVTFNGTLTLGR